MVPPEGRRVCALHDTRAALRGGAQTRVPRARSLERAMEYERYKPKSPRPLGMGAFFDFGLAMTRHSAARLPRASAWRKKSLVVPPAPQSAEERWDAEGGNSETRIARRAARYEP